MSREEIAFTAQPKIYSHSQIFRCGGSIFCLPHRPNFSDIFDLCLHWVSVVRGQRYTCRVLQTIQMKLILLYVWAEQAILGSAKTALKFKYEI